MATRHDQLRELFIAACDLPPAERVALLDRECVNDSELRLKLEKLLRQDESEEGILAERHITTRVHYAAETTVEVVMPETIGRYRIKRILGQGGMAVVYLAEQEDPQRDVAVKVIRPGIVSDDLLKRFKLETTVLGLLDHPGIARILEGGAAKTAGPSGETYSQPYFAMEYVDGCPITQYAALNRLPAKSKLQLMADVCQAVHSAHQRGIIHRDLKAANILVTKPGQAKILDFGVARLVGDDPSMGSHSTQFGQLIGTPAYMSPEQMGGDPNEIDTRTDVYSLGVVLYEMLTGDLPYVSDQPWRSEAYRKLKQSPPERLSRRDPTLRGDVETIVQKALEGNKHRRYQSALELAADINRYLNYLPIVARPQTALYQARKYAQRHRALVGGFAAVLIVLLGGIAATIWQAEKAVRQRDKAGEQALRANETKELLESMILAATPENTRGSQPTIRQMLEETTRQLRNDDSIHPIVAADTHQTLANAYISLGDLDSAEFHAIRAVELHSEISGPDAAETLDDQMILAQVYSRKDRDAEAIAIMAQALQRANQLFEPTHDLLIDLYLEYGFVLGAAANPDREFVVDQYRASYELAVAKYGWQNDRTLRAAMSLGSTLMDMGKLEEAEIYLREVYRSRLARMGGDHPETLIAQHNLSVLHTRKGDFPSALKISQDQVELAEVVLGGDHPSTIRYRLHLARAQIGAGQPEEAARTARDTLEMATGRLGAVHDDTLNCSGVLISALRISGQLDEAEELAVKQYQQCVQGLGPQHPYTTKTITLLFDLAEAKSDVKGMRRWAEKLVGTEWEKPAQDMVRQMEAKLAQSEFENAVGD